MEASGGYERDIARRLVQSGLEVHVVGILSICVYENGRFHAAC
jgi:transposase